MGTDRTATFVAMRGAAARAAGAVALLVAGAAGTAMAAAPDFLFVVVDAAGTAAKSIAGAPERCPSLHALARKGVTLINVTPSTKDRVQTIGELLGQNANGIVRAAREKYSPARVWVCAERAGRMADLGRDVNFFAPDVRHGAFTPVVERYGLGSPLGVEEMAAVAMLRARYGPELTAPERELGKLFTTEEYPFDAETAMFRRVMQLVQAREAACVVALVSGARNLGRTTPEEDAIRIDRRVGELWALLGEEPYRNRAACVYVSLACGASDPTLATSALLLGPGFQTGMVVQAPASTATLNAVLLRVMGRTIDVAPAPDGILAP